jgi:hypothetical protein
MSQKIQRTPKAATKTRKRQPRTKEQPTKVDVLRLEKSRQEFLSSLKEIDRLQEPIFNCEEFPVQNDRSDLIKSIDTIKRPLYWHTVWLGLRGIGGAIAIPFYVVGLLIRGLRAIGDLVRWIATGE